MTVRLDPTTRRKVERLAAREGISLNAAFNRLLQRSLEEGGVRARRWRYRLKPRKLGFGFDIPRARELAEAMSDEQKLGKINGRS